MKTITFFLLLIALSSCIKNNDEIPPFEYLSQVQQVIKPDTVNRNEEFLMKISVLMNSTSEVYSKHVSFTKAGSTYFYFYNKEMGLGYWVSDGYQKEIQYKVNNVGYHYLYFAKWIYTFSNDTFYLKDSIFVE